MGWRVVRPQREAALGTRWTRATASTSARVPRAPSAMLAAVSSALETRRVRRPSRSCSRRVLAARRAHRTLLFAPPRHALRRRLPRRAQQNTRGRVRHARIEGVGEPEASLV